MVRLMLAVLTLCTLFMTRARSSLPRVRKSALVTPLTVLWDDVLDLALEVMDFIVSLSGLSVVCRSGNSDVDSGSNDSLTFFRTCLILQEGRFCILDPPLVVLLFAKTGPHALAC